MGGDEILLVKVTRIEVIDAHGRAFVQAGYHPAGVTIEVQDDGRTIKIFAGYPGGDKSNE
jgi:hypothetical protein